MEEMTAKQKKEAAMTPAQKVERSIIKKFKKEIWRKFTASLNDYHMIEEGDVIGIPVHADIRSILIAMQFGEIAKHGIQNFRYELFILPEADKELLAYLNLPSQVNCTADTLSECVRATGCTKVTSCEDFDDIIETIVYGMLYEAKVETILPVEAGDGITTIRPLYTTAATEIEHWIAYNELKSRLYRDENRAAVREMLTSLEKENKYVPMNIFRSVENVNLATLVAYKKDGELHHFLDRYEEE